MKEGDDILDRAFNDPVSDGVRLASDLLGIPGVEVFIDEVFLTPDGEPYEDQFGFDPDWGPIEAQRRLEEWRAGRYSLTRGLPMPSGLEGLSEAEVFRRRLEAMSPEQAEAYEAYHIRLARMHDGPGGQ